MVLPPNPALPRKPVGALPPQVDLAELMNSHAPMVKQWPRNKKSSGHPGNINKAQNPYEPALPSVIEKPHGRQEPGDSGQLRETSPGLTERAEASERAHVDLMRVKRHEQASARPAGNGKLPGGESPVVNETVMLIRLLTQRLPQGVADENELQGLLITWGEIEATVNGSQEQVDALDGLRATARGLEGDGTGLELVCYLICHGGV